MEAFLPLRLAGLGYHINVWPKTSLTNLLHYPSRFPQTQKLKVFFLVNITIAFPWRCRATSQENQLGPFSSPVSLLSWRPEAV